MSHQRFSSNSVSRSTVVVHPALAVVVLGNDHRVAASFVAAVAAVAPLQNHLIESETEVVGMLLLPLH